MTMPLEYPGNLIPGPAYVPSGQFTTDVEILASGVGWRQIGIDVAPGQGVIQAGTVMGQVTATKRWVVYKSTNSDGSQVPHGVLRMAVNTGTDVNGPVYRNNLVTMGTLKYSKISGADANAITSLGARVDTLLRTFKFKSP